MFIAPSLHKENGSVLKWFFLETFQNSNTVIEENSNYDIQKTIVIAIAQNFQLTEVFAIHLIPRHQ